MRWFASLLLLRAWITAASKLTEPTIYLYDPSSPDSRSDQTTAVTPETARLIFADRLGLSHLYSLEEVDDTSLQQINSYGGDHRDFGFQRPEWGQSKTIFIIDGVQEISSAVENFQTFTMSETPSRQHNKDLFDRLEHEMTQRPTSGPYHERMPSSASQRMGLILTESTISESCPSAKWRSDGEVSLVHLDCGLTASSMREVLSVLYKIASEEQMKLTIAMMPAKPSKPSTPSSMPYGPVLDRELPLHNFDRRQEAILEEPAVSAKQSSTPSTTSRLQIPASSLPVAFVPQCFASEDDCNKGTNNCTGHGACIVKSKTGTSGSEEEGGSSNCYVCSCNKPEVIKNKDGTTKTTYFGGSACQKKDISAPFWILTLTAGSFLALVGFGISMLYAMGQAELPSVIGAGVSGPRAK